MDPRKEEFTVGRRNLGHYGQFTRRGADPGRHNRIIGHVGIERDVDVRDSPRRLIHAAQSALPDEVHGDTRRD